MPLILRQHHPRQFEHIGVVRHGIATGPNRIEFVAPIKDTTEANRIVQGSVVSLDQNGTFVAGAAAGDAAVLAGRHRDRRRTCGRGTCGKGKKSHHAHAPGKRTGKRTRTFRSHGKLLHTRYFAKF